MAVNKFLENLRASQSGAAPDPSSDIPRQDDDDCVERGGDGRPMDAKHATFALELVYSNRNANGIMYGSKEAAFYSPSHGIRLIYTGWHFASWDDYKPGTYLVTIRGRNLERAFDKLMCGVRTKVKEDGDSVTGIEVTKIEAAREE